MCSRFRANFRTESSSSATNESIRGSNRNAAGIGHEKSVTILPRSEKRQIASRELLAPLTPYFPDDALIVLDEPLAIREEVKKLAAQSGGHPYIMPWDKVEGELAKFTQLRIAQVPFAAEEGVARVQLAMGAIAGWQGQNDAFWKQIEQWDREKFTVVLLCATSGERKRLYELLEERGYRPGQDAFDLRVDIGRLRAGFVVPADKLAVLSEHEMFGRHYVRRARRRFEAGTALTAFSDLKSGDYIVHEQHGIGRYLGLKRFEGKAGDFLALQYTGGDKVYVAVTHVDMIQKFSGGDGAVQRWTSWAGRRGRGPSRA